MRVEFSLRSNVRQVIFLLLRCGYYIFETKGCSLGTQSWPEILSDTFFIEVKCIYYILGSRAHMIETKSIAINHVYPCMCIATFSRYNQKMYSQHFEKFSCIANPGIGSYFAIFQGIATFRKKSITKKKPLIPSKLW